MSLYWVYDIPNWMFGMIVVGSFLIFGLLGVMATRRRVRRLHLIDHSHNDIVGFFLASITVFYGITLGLVAVGTWESFASVSSKVDAEAQAIASIYRDAGSYNGIIKGLLQQDLRDYTRDVIDVSWPLQRKGIVPVESGQYLTNFQTHLMTFEPTTMSQQILQAEVFKQFNVLVEIRRGRLNTVTEGLPSSIWILVLLGGVLSIMVTWFFDTKSLGMHMWMTGLLSVLLGLLVFLVGTLDNPFRGQVSVGPTALEMVYSQLVEKN